MSYKLEPNTHPLICYEHEMSPGLHVVLACALRALQRPIVKGTATMLSFSLGSFLQSRPEVSNFYLKPVAFQAYQVHAWLAGKNLSAVIVFQLLDLQVSLCYLNLPG